MCRPVKCRQCGKTTWAGCGQHVDQVRRGVAPGDWCGGHSGEDAAKPGFVQRLFGARSN